VIYQRPLLSYLPKVALVGRPNVGKSTLFNRLLSKRQAITHSQPEITRDRLEGIVNWEDKEFIIIDTGGLKFTNLPLQKEIENQVKFAIKEAEVVLFVVDARTGVLPLDEEIAQFLRLANRQIILVINKAEEITKEEEIKSDFSHLGFHSMICISAEHSINIGELLSMVTEDFPSNIGFSPSPTVSVSILGAPNVGKSSLFNAICGEKRAVVSPIPGTTRDPVDTFIKYFDELMLFVDTAGLKKKSRLNNDIEYYENLRTFKTIQRADIVLFLLDVTRGITNLEQKIGGEIIDKGKGCIIIWNKWDLADKEKEYFINEVKRKLYFLNFVPVLFTSAVKQLNIENIFIEIKKVKEEYRKRIPSSQLQRVCEEALILLPPKVKGGKQLKINSVKQIKEAPPTFLFKINSLSFITPYYKRYLESRIRESFIFYGVPLKFIFKERYKK